MRHNILVNTLSEDSILFPRAMKVLIINMIATSVFLGGIADEVYRHNTAVEKLTMKYLGHSLEDKQIAFESIEEVDESFGMIALASVVSLVIAVIIC